MRLVSGTVVKTKVKSAANSLVACGDTVWIHGGLSVLMSAWVEVCVEEGKSRSSGPLYILYSGQHCCVSYEIATLFAAALLMIGREAASCVIDSGSPPAALLSVSVDRASV